MTSLRRVPISGWQRCAHEAASFESKGEYKAATLLDVAMHVEWWIRNDPVILKIATPIGNFEPDFIYRIRRGEVWVMGILEIKGSIFWNGEGSGPRIHADAACEWVSAIKNADAGNWEFAAVLDQDAWNADSLDAMLANAQRRCA
jgi:hypothetical protein